MDEEDKSGGTVKLGGVDPGPRSRALTEKGAQYRAVVSTRELNAAASSLGRLLDRVSAAIADGAALEEAKGLRNDALVKNDELTAVYQRLSDVDLGDSVVDTRLHDKVVARYDAALQEVNKYILEQRLETQSNASNRSSVSRRALPPAREESSSADRAIERLANVLTRSSSRKLPMPEPEVFDGDRFKFALWLQSFQAMVEEQVEDKADCLFYLNRYLRGEPKEMVLGLIPLHRSEAYWKAKSMLIRRYGDSFTTNDAYRQRLYNWPKIPSQDGVALRKFADFLENCVQASELLPGLKTLDDPRENQRLLKKLPPHISAKWASMVDDQREEMEHGLEHASGPRDEQTASPGYFYPSFAEFASFIRKQARIACDPITSASALREPSDGVGKDRPMRRTCVSTRSSLSTHTVEDARSPAGQPGQRPPMGTSGRIDERKMFCGVCDAKHCTADCHLLWETPPVEREKLVKEKEAGDTASTGNNTVPKSVVANAATVGGDVELVSHTLIVPVWLHHSDNVDNRVLTYAILDEQSDASFISDECLERLLAPSRPATLRISTIVGETVVDTKKVDRLMIQGYTEDKQIALSAFSRSEIPAKRAQIPRRRTTDRWAHLRDVTEHLMPYSELVPVGLLIGTDCSAALRPVEVVTGGPTEPYGIKTALGWGVVGRVAAATRSDGSNESVSVGCLRTVVRHKEILGTSMSDHVRAFSYEDTKFVALMEHETRRMDDGRFVAPLPLRDERVSFPNNRLAVRGRLMRLKSRLKRDNQYFLAYGASMKNLLDCGFARKVNPAEITGSSEWYIPHHGINHNVTNKKFRVVFDCSAEFGGQSLNQNLMQGPDLTSNLVGVLLRFREEVIAVACDIEKMFYQVKVKPEHCRFLRFLWWSGDSLDEEPVDYEMTVHIFGASSSPSVANWVLKAAASAGANEHNTAAVDFVRRNFYVDDGLQSVHSTGEALKLLSDSKEICAQAGFKLCKFLSNDMSVVEALEQEATTQGMLSLSGNHEHPEVQRTLGIQWEVELDNIRFVIDQKTVPVTRRGILSSVYSVFDPLGLVAPVLLIGKCILQCLCRGGIGWDDLVPQEIASRWVAWRNSLASLAGWSIPRCYKPPHFGVAVIREFHHFSDASTVGFGHCTYLRQVNTAGDVHCSLVMAKSRVAPLKVTTIPRLELMACVLSAEACEFVKLEMDESTQHHFWTDSKVALGYINNDARKFHVFVANRVQKIRDVSSPNQWHHVKTENNPADLVSRGVEARQLVCNEQWWKGPSFLWYRHIPAGDEVGTNLGTADPEVKNVVNSVCTAEEFDLDNRLKGFSTWQAAKRAIALCLRAQSKFRGVTTTSRPRRTPSDYVAVSLRESIAAEAQIIRQVQHKFYKNLYDQLDKAESGNLSVNAYLRHLDPFVAPDGLLRVGGRIKHSTFAYKVKHPIIIPKNSELARLIIEDCHVAVKHQGRGFTLGETRNRGFWIVRGASTVASHVYKCTVCRRVRGRSIQQKMGDLPEDRFICEPPFTACGVDCFGPWYVREGRSDKKRYGVIFTCMASRAVHIEVAAQMTTDSFINAFRRFVGRRGPVRLMRSDRGSNFLGAYNELNLTRTQSILRESGCEWEFNPPHSSHMGGCWERHIRTVRSIMNTILYQHGSLLNEETLNTFLVETENIMNSRPLCVEDLGAETPEPLTPNHLLTGKMRVVLPPPVELRKGDQYARRHWKRVQYLADEFWNRWRKGYLQTLQRRSKWQNPRKNVAVGDIVIVTDNETQRNAWQLARVVRTFPDAQGLVRKVKLVMGDKYLNSAGKRVKAQTYLERPVHSLVYLISD